MSQRQVRPLLRGFLTPSLQDQAAAGLLDLHIRAAVWLVGKVALKHALAFPHLPDQTRHRRSDDERALHRHAVGPLSWAGNRLSPCPEPRAHP